MQVASKLFQARKHPFLSDAKLAYFEGDFERCLEICANIRVRSLASASEITLITARAQLRSGKPREAQNILVAARDTHTTLDACLTSQMLEATALIRQNEVDAGIALLVDAAGIAADAHFAIRSEIAFSTALGYWAKREINVAETYLKFVDPRSDIIHARALDLQAWCHTARGDYRRSAAFFRLSLLRLDDCQANDRAIAANAISTLAIFAAELFDREMSRFVELRLPLMAWSPGLVAHRYVTLEHQALFHEFNGDTMKAYQLALEAEESASSVADKVFGWALKSSIARNAGEAYSAMTFARRAQGLLDTLKPEELHGEERFSMLSVAETCAHFDIGAASKLFAAYSSLAPLDPMLSTAERDPRRTAHETYIAGVVAQGRGERDRAAACFRKALDTFRAVGYVRRAVISANALLRLVVDEDAQFYVRSQLAGTSNYVSDGISARADAAAASLARHPLVASLPRAQREITVLICLGKSNKEIAELRCVGEQTIKNTLTKNVFPAFGVSSRSALVSACLREGQAAADDRNTVALRRAAGRAV